MLPSVVGIDPWEPSTSDAQAVELSSFIVFFLITSQLLASMGQGWGPAWSM